ncbi:MAG: hypothetical protein ACRDMI_15880, partial [Streptosporangiaceae bacterium]
MNAISRLAVSQHPAGTGHYGVLLLLILALAAVGYGAVRLNRRRQAGRRRDGPAVPVGRPGPREAPPAEPPDPAPPRQPVADMASPRQPLADAAPSLPPRAAVSFQPPAGGWAVEAHGLTKRFGSTAAVDDVDLL